MWMQKYTPVPRLNKGISCQEKGDNNCSIEQGGQAQISGGAAARMNSDLNIVIAHLKGWGMKQTNHFNLGIESRWCLNHVRDL